MLERRHVEIAYQHGMCGAFWPQPIMRLHFVKEVEFVPKFWIDVRVRLVAASGHIKIMKRNRSFQFCALSQCYGDMPAINLPAKILNVDPLKGHARKHRNAVIPFLSVKRRVFIAQTPETLHWEDVVRTLRLLQAEHVRSHALEKSGDQINAQAHRIDVPCRDFQ
jgi:hypothetical protein